MLRNRINNVIMIIDNETYISANFKITYCRINKKIQTSNFYHI